MQAGAMKLYSIVTDINGCNEIVKEGENGTIIPPKNKEALLKKMEETLDQNFFYNPDSCREIIKRNYERNYVWEKLLLEYQSLEKEI